jgi:hypothetical protein
MPKFDFSKQSTLDSLYTRNARFAVHLAWPGKTARSIATAYAVPQTIAKCR